MRYSSALLNSRSQSIQNIWIKKLRSFVQKQPSFIIYIFLCCITGSQVAYAQWSSNSAISVGGGQHPGIVSDGTGGSIIAWFTGSSIGAQRINAAGISQWAAGGVTIGSGLGQQIPAAITTDEAGGAIITWIYNTDIYAQRVNASGVLQWTAGGIPICTALNNQLDPSIVNDGAGGAIITWYDYRSGTGIYAQRVNASGAVQWTTNGVAICSATSTGTSNQDGPQIVSDNAGGAIISWKDNRSGNVDIYAQRINANGAVEWATNGIAICNLTSAQDEPKMVSDGTGSTVITWKDNRNGNYDIYAQRINTSGITEWTADGVAICTLGGADASPIIVNDAAGGSIIAWVRTNGIYAQRINSLGEVQWTADPIPISTGINQSVPAITNAGAGGAIITWMDLRNSIDYDIYAQQINGSGAAQWTANGVPVRTTAGSQGYPVILSNGSNGAFISWNNSPSGGIYAQNLNADGTIGPAAIPVISCPAGNTSITSNITGAMYQWQLNTGNGFVNISDNSNYAGTNSVSLQLNTIPSDWYGYLYRCVVNGLNSTSFKLQFSDNWAGTVDSNWESPANWSCGTVPDSNTDVIINSGTVVINANTTIRTLTLAPGVIFTVTPGVILTITHP